MGLLHDIQKAVLNDSSDLGPILLKVRLLAARLGSEPLGEWVQHESEGYPADAQLPDYRIIPVSYTATFSGPFGSGIKNAPIAPYLIEKFAGAEWNRHKMRQSIAAVDELFTSSEGGSGAFHINASNLILLLQGNVYEDFACNAVSGTISRASIAEIRHVVRSRVLELTIELEKAVPGSVTISIENVDNSSPATSAVVTQISQQIIYGNLTSISNVGDGTQINISIEKGDISALVEYLKQAGIVEADAKELAEIVASEEPESKQEPFGIKAKAWLVENLKKASNGTWKIGVSVATDVIKQAVLKYYGLL